ncbi:ABC transporter substrate-binding protein [Actinoplanes sp. SE50]|uniref:N-acetylglucosamine/diacetylchitobiose ABC transporter substrate-binding protein n=1 Tax=unclassified Actinoplanes TaxID=2626549 RepID=UPI00023EC281|nr:MULTISPECIES: N-acetylglucosamine/diacetylchitobiose ABC transporter substrate-binding protein [unclassified Actinoplanes]AEV84094.1 Maltose-binding periplasmic protein [Actinoplanes sp. SE50/110]ATO82486.1 ABC transporter substrate-binding protein [Actinoplanes sp. SE50]SLL99893.1 carbohydrate ABC transporter, N-acetylglucosamine/diacetylchitobiose-binding protein [Actinoplanes sp. SE50/110]
MEYDVSRRDLLRCAAGVAAVGALGGCALGGGDVPGDPTVTRPVSAANPLGVPADAPLEVVIFNGGFGEDYAREHEARYRQRYPRARIRHSATQQIAETLQPRFVAGDPPDVVDNSGGSQIDFNALVGQGALADLTDLLDAPSLDDPTVRVRDTLLPGIVEVGSYGGRFLTLNYAYSAYGIWYSRKLFEARGWSYPRTWDEMIALCRRIKAAGIAPWTYPGVHARYMSWPILAAAAKLGGLGVLKAIDNLEPGAWRHEAVRTAAEAYRQLAVDGFLQPGAAGMDHIQAQTEWCRGRAAFVSCGSWLENEMRSVTPPDFAMTVAPTPSFTATDSMPFTAFRGTGSEPFIVPAKAKNVRGGLEYLRIMLSRTAAAAFTTRVGSLTAVAGATGGQPLSAGLTAVTAMVDASRGSAFTWLYATYYRKLERERVNAATLDLLTGRCTGAQWCDRIQRSADECAADPGVKKYQRV